MGCVRWELGHVLEVHDAGHVFGAEVAGSLVSHGDLGDAFSIVEWGWYECDLVRFVIRHRAVGVVRLVSLVLECFDLCVRYVFEVDSIVVYHTSMQ